MKIKVYNLVKGIFMKTESEKRKNGEEYSFYDNGISESTLKAKKLCYKLNNISPEEITKKKEVLEELLGSFKVNIEICANFACELGENIHVGENFFANVNCVILDTAKVNIGNDCFIGPNVGIYTVNHSMNSIKRKNGIEQGFSITIGNNVWIGGNSVILPGVNIGDNVVIGGGSVVTNDIESNTLVAGNPAKFIKKLD